MQPLNSNEHDVDPATATNDKLAKLFWEAKHTTVTYCFVFWGFGMCVAFLGPTQLDLGCKTGSVTSTMSWVFFAQSLFILVGSAIAAKIIHKIPVNVILFMSTTMSAITLAVIPKCHTWGLLAVVLAVMGLFMGLIDTVVNVSMITLYGKSVSPFLQTLHFFYGLGAFVSPMVAERFLLNEDCTIFLTSSNGTENATSSYNTSALPAKTLQEAQKMTKIDNAFWIMALLQIPVVILVLTLLVKQIYDVKISRTADSQSLKSGDEYEAFNKGENEWNKKLGVLPDADSEHLPANTLQVGLITFLIALLLFVYDGLQAAYGGYVFTYATKNLADMSPSEAAYLNAYFWGTFALGRLLSIIVATKLSPIVMLLGNISGCTLSMLLMLIWSENRIAIYLGTCLFGAFLSSVYPTAVSLAEQFIKVTSVVTSIVVVGAASGEMLLPVIVGHQLDESPVTFLVIGFVLTFASFFIYGSVLIVGCTINKTQGPGYLAVVIDWVTSVIAPKGATIESENTGLVNHQVKYYNRVNSGSDPNLAQVGSSIETLPAANYEINHEDYTRRLEG